MTEAEDDSNKAKKPCRGLKSSSISPRKDPCTEKTDDSISLLQRLVAASSGAMMTILLVTPLEVVKTRLQHQAGKVPPGQCFYFYNGLMDNLCVACEMKNPCEWYQRPGNFNGTLDGLVKIARNEGIRSLWSGLTPTLIMSVPSTVLFFTMYDKLHLYLRNKFCELRNESSSSWVPPAWAAASLASITSRTSVITVVSPLEVVRTKMQSEKMRYADVGKIITDSFRAHGFKPFFAGLGPTLLRDIPFSTIYWTSYEATKRQWMKWEGLEKPTLAVNLICGSTCGALTSVVTHPMDVIKTHQQITLGSVDKHRPSSRETFSRLTANGHWRSLYAGVVPRAMKVAPSCGILIASYEYFKQYFSRHNH